MLFSASLQAPTGRKEACPRQMSTQGDQLPHLKRGVRRGRRPPSKWQHLRRTKGVAAEPLCKARGRGWDPAGLPRRQVSESKP